MQLLLPQTSPMGWITIFFSLTLTLFILENKMKMCFNSKNNSLLLKVYLFKNKM